MWVSVMNIRIMRVLVNQRFVAMQMFMGLGAVPCEFVVVLVMLVMPMAVAMFDRLMLVQVFVVLRQVEPHAERH